MISMQFKNKTLIIRFITQNRQYKQASYQKQSSIRLGVVE